MSTRANIAFGDKGNKNIGWMYHHFDGYPDGPIPQDINWINEQVKNKKIRPNAEQAMGWLIRRGISETEDTYAPPKWQASEYEPSLGIHYDIEYLYLIRFNFKEMEWKYLKVNFNDDMKEYVDKAVKWISGEEEED